MAQRRLHMRTQASQAERRRAGADAILTAWEADVAFDAWTLEELDDELGSLRPAFAQGDDAGS
jgi:hypothetical protein